MPRIQFIPDNIVNQGSTFPRLKLDAKESARIVVLEDPTFVYIHTLRAPEIGPDGKVIMTKVERKGEEVDVIKQKFVGRHQCTGDLNTLQEGRGVDPDNCLMCEASIKTSQVDAPQRRFGVHVAKYATKQGTWDVLKGAQFSAQIQLWMFTEGIFTKLIGFQKEFGSLLQHDLKLGPCENKDYQKFDINIAADAEWLKTAKTKTAIAEAKEENTCEDVETEIAKRKDRKWIEQDLKTVSDMWKIANGVAVDPAEAKAELTQDLANLIGNGKPAVATKVEAPVEEPEADPEPVVEEVAAPVAVESDPVPVADDELKVAPKSLSFDELMGNV